MLYAFVVLVIVACAAVLMNEGLFSAATIYFCALFAGLLAFNFFEPAAALIDSVVPALSGYSDCIALLGLFTIFTTGLRLVSEQIAPTMVEFPDLVHRGGGFVIGAFTGWMCAGIFLCALQTLPLHREFLGYDHRDVDKAVAWNCDRYWLAFVHRTSRKGFNAMPAKVFDPRADFVIRYALYRRTGDDGTAAAAPAYETRGAPVKRSAGRTE